MFPIILIFTQAMNEFMKTTGFKILMKINIMLRITHANNPSKTFLEISDYPNLGVEDQGFRLGLGHLVTDCYYKDLGFKN